VFTIAAPRDTSLGQTLTVLQEKLTIEYCKDRVIQKDNTDEERKQLRNGALNAI